MQQQALFATQTYNFIKILTVDLPEASFGAIIDKALFDSLLCTQTSSTAISQYIYEVDRLLDDTGVFIMISYGNPEQRLHYIEQYDIDEPYFTPWLVEVQAIGKPKQYVDEDLDPSDPNSMYFIYICRKSRDLVIKKKIKLGHAKKKAQKASEPVGHRVNLKPAAG